MRLSAWIHTSRHAHLQVGVMRAGHVCLYHTLSRELVLEPQLDQKEMSASGFRIVGLKVNLKDHFP